MGFQILGSLPIVNSRGSGTADFFAHVEAQLLHRQRDIVTSKLEEML